MNRTKGWVVIEYETNSEVATVWGHDEWTSDEAVAFAEERWPYRLIEGTRMLYHPRVEIRRLQHPDDPLAPIR